MAFLLKNSAVFFLVLLTFTQVSMANDFYPLEDGSLWKIRTIKPLLKKRFEKKNLVITPLFYLKFLKVKPSYLLNILLLLTKGFLDLDWMAKGLIRGHYS